MFSRCYKTLCFAVLAALCGCGQIEPMDTLAEPEVQVAATDAIEQSIVVKRSSTDTLAETTLAKAESTITAQEATDQEVTEQRIVDVYQPPYPDRVDLFLAPKREGKSTLNDREGAVELLGFVNVDRHRAVLLINGAVYPIAEGDSQLGVEVISIQPPAVVLQRGRQRWQATLEN
ncbi:MAG: hypothetical protein IH898_01110 [Planctomycetes bacterium]|nr:hypothetical protein [Planctomycetota bacterium]